MKRLLVLFALFAVAVMTTALAELALVAAPETINGETVTNAVTAPRGMTGWAEVDIVAAALPTNAPAVYSLYTVRGEGTNAALVALSQYAPPLTNAAPIAVMRFPAAAVNTNIVLVTEFAEAVTNSRAAVLRYTPTYPPR